MEARREMQGLGFDQLNIPVGVLTSSHATAFFIRDGELAGCAGVNEEGNGIGRVWMLCTEAIHKEPISFIRQAK